MAKTKQNKSTTDIEIIYTLEADVRGISTYSSTVFARKLVVPISACLFNVIVSLIEKKIAIAMICATRPRPGLVEWTI